jgi:hypothetical protein
MGADNGTVRRAVFLALTVMLVGAWSAGAGAIFGEPRPPTAESLRRPLHLPSMRGEMCPVATKWSQPSRDLGFTLGTGPARPVGLRSDGTLEYVSPVESNAWPPDATAWGGNKVL